MAQRKRKSLGKVKTASKSKAKKAATKAKQKPGKKHVTPPRKFKSAATQDLGFGDPKTIKNTGQYKGVKPGKVSSSSSPVRVSNVNSDVSFTVKERCTSKKNCVTTKRMRNQNVLDSIPLSDSKSLKVTPFTSASGKMAKRSIETNSDRSSLCYRTVPPIDKKSARAKMTAAQKKASDKKRSDLSDEKTRGWYRRGGTEFAFNDGVPYLRQCFKFKRAGYLVPLQWDSANTIAKEVASGGPAVGKKKSKGKLGGSRKIFKPFTTKTLASKQKKYLAGALRKGKLSSKEVAVTKFEGGWAVAYPTKQGVNLYGMRGSHAFVKASDIRKWA